jgi:hypothetical protein
MSRIRGPFRAQGSWIGGQSYEAEGIYSICWRT